MGRTVEFDDLVDSGGSRTKEGSDDDTQEVPADDGGIDLLGTLQFLDERGYLQQLMALQQQQAGGSPRAAAGGGAGGAGGAENRGSIEQTTEQTTDETTENMTEKVDHETIVNALKKIYDFKGNISLKELIQLIENNPEMADRLIEENL